MALGVSSVSKSCLTAVCVVRHPILPTRYSVLFMNIHDIDALSYKEDQNSRQRPSSRAVCSVREAAQHRERRPTKSLAAFPASLMSLISAKLCKRPSIPRRRRGAPLAATRGPVGGFRLGDRDALRQPSRGAPGALGQRRSPAPGCRCPRRSKRADLSRPDVQGLRRRSQPPGITESRHAQARRPRNRPRRSPHLR
jgi:hypothetical protein